MLREFLKEFKILSDTDIAEFEQLLKKRDVKKGEYFIQNGAVCKSIAFVMSGIFRTYFISDKWEEVTYCLTFPNNFLTAYSSYLTGNSTQENIQAIQDAELYIISKEEMENLADNNITWLIFLKFMAEQQYMELENRIFQLQKKNALSKYKNLIENYPQLVQQIPLQYLASYLGITQRHLTRIRKEITY